MSNEVSPPSANPPQPPQPSISQEPQSTSNESLRSTPEVKKNPKILLLTLAIALLAAGLTFAGYQLGRKSQLGLKLPSLGIIPTPASSSLPTFAPSPIPTTSPTATPTPTPNPTAGWKSYTNEKYGYSIGYPQDWVFQPDKQTPEEIVNFMKDLNSLSAYSGTASTGTPPGAIPSKITSVTIGGREATKETYEKLFELIKFPEEFKVNQIVIRFKDGVYNEEYSDTFNLMLSTFKFLN